MGEKEEFSLNDYNLILTIGEIKDLNNITFAEISREVEMSQTNPRLIRILCFLIDNNIMYFISEGRGNSKIYKINKRLLYKCLRNQDKFSILKRKMDKAYPFQPSLS